LKKLLIGITTVLVVLVATVLIAPTFINWNQYRDEICAQARDALGRELEIRGDIKITVLPSPALVINDVHLANVEGASSADMVTLKSIEVHVALAPLLGRIIQVTSIRLVEPVIKLEVLEDGANNMTFGTEAASGKPAVSSAPLQPPQPSPSAGAPDPGTSNGLGIPSIGGFAVQIDSFVIEKGRLRFRDVPGGRDELIGDLNGKFRLASLNGPMDMEGSAVVRNIPLSFSASAGQIVQDRTLPFRIATTIIPGDVKIGLNGAVSSLRETPTVKGKFTLDGANLNAFVAGVAGGAALPSALGRQFTAQAIITANQKKVDVAGLAFTLDETKGTGKVTASLGKTIATEATLTINKFDLDKLMAPPSQLKPVAPKAAPSNDANSSALVIPTSKPKTKQESFSLKALPDNLEAGLDIAIEALTFKGKAIRQAKLTAELANQEITLSQLSALLPGNTDLAVFGIAAEKTKGPAFDGSVDLTTNDLRGMLDWLGADAGDIAKDRLRKLAVSGKILANPETFNLSALDLQIDSTNVELAATVTLRDRLSLGATVNVDKINLDAYLPAPNKSAAPSGKPAPKTTKNNKPAPAARPAPSTSAVNPLAPLGLLGTFDMNLKASVGALTFKGVPVSNVAVDTTLLNGTLTFNDWSVKNLASIEGKVTGNLAGLNPSNGLADPFFQDFKFDIRGKSLKRFFKLMEIQSPIDPGKFGAVALTGALNGKPRNLEVSANMNALRGTFSINGTAQPLNPLPSLTGQIALSHPNLLSLLRTFDVAYRPASRTLGGVNLKSNIAASATAIALTGINGTAAGVKLGGDLGVQLNGPKPAITANLATSALDLNKFLPRLKRASLENGLEWGHAFDRRHTPPLLHKAFWPAVPRLQTNNPLLHKAISDRWSGDPIDLAVLNDFEANVALKTPRLIFDKLPLDNVDLAAALKNGILDIRRATGNLFGGNVKLDGKVATTQGAGQYQSRFTVSGVSMPSALRAFGNKTLESGIMEVIGEFRTSGRSVADMVSRLNGTGSLSLNGLDVTKGAGAGSAFSGVTGLLESVYHFAGSLGGKIDVGKADLRGSFQVDKGIASYNDMTLTSSVGTGSAKGVVDLPNWQINTSGALQLSQNLLVQVLVDQKGPTTIPFQVSGFLNKPNVKLDTSKIAAGGLRIPGRVGKKLDKILKKKGVGSVLQKIFPGSRSQQPAPQQQNTGAPPPQEPPQQNQRQPSSPKPEDLLKNLLRSLGR